MIYNYILGFDTDDNQWFHNVEAEDLFMENKPIWDADKKEYIGEYSADGKFLPLTDELLIKFYKQIIALNKGGKNASERMYSQMDNDN